MVKDAKDAHYLTKEECKKKTEELLKKQEDPNFMIELTFKKDKNGWYADLDEHTRGQNSMVCNSDKILDMMSGGKKKLVLKFRFVENKKLQPLFTMKRIAASHATGATYLACGLTVIPFPCWICQCGNNVYGNAPKRLYVYAIEHR